METVDLGAISSIQVQGLCLCGVVLSDAWCDFTVIVVKDRFSSKGIMIADAEGKIQEDSSVFLNTSSFAVSWILSSQMRSVSDYVPGMQLSWRSEL